MRSVRIEAFGDESQVQVVDVPAPSPAAGEVVVELKACGLNYADVMQRIGMYVGGPKPPYHPGMEGAGVVVAHGPGVTAATSASARGATPPAPPLGARVIVMAAGGLQAERVAVRARDCLPLPDALSFAQGAAFPVNFLTAYHALITVAHAVPGEVVVIHAAGGGVGTAAVQIAARKLGLTVIATASTEEKRAKVRALGAHVAVGYDDFEAAAKERSGGRGPAIIIESIGGDVFKRSLAALAPLGRMVVLGVAGREAAPVDPVKLLFRSQGVLGLHLNAIFGRPELFVSSLQTMLGWIAAGDLAIQVGHTLPLADVRKAHELIASRQSFGKIVLVP